MRVFFVTYCYPPVRSPQAILISRLVGFLKDHLDLQVIAPPPCDRPLLFSWPKFLREKLFTTSPRALVDPSLEKFVSKKIIRYVKPSLGTRFIEEIRGDRLKKKLLPDTFFFWSGDAYQTLKEVVRPDDIVVTFGCPMSTHYTGLFLKKKFPSLKWYAYLSDLWVDDFFYIKEKIPYYFHSALKKETFQRADKLFFSSKATIELMTKGFSREVSEKSFLLPHSFDDSFLPINPEKQAGPSYTLRYFGGCYGASQPDCFLEGLRILKAKDSPILDQITVEFIGGLYKNDARLQGLEYVIHTRDSLPYLDALKIMQKTDVLLAIDATPKRSVVFLSKIAEYMSVKRPIFCVSSPGTCQEIVDDLGYFSCPPDPQAIAQALETQFIPLLSAQGNDSVRSLYHIHQVGSDFLKHFKE